MMQSKRIDPLLKRAQEKEDTVARDLAERQRTLDTHLSRLDELRRYAEEYANAQMAATSPAQLLNRRAFLDRLDSAVSQQSQTVDSNREKVEAERARQGHPFRAGCAFPPPAVPARDNWRQAVRAPACHGWPAAGARARLP
ncbi:flagellar export protein FliJ, partial [Stenotrophomonas chelatiphaga]|uniref:flagellar export protein FliJ n=1 Tax=Stenotrophomonas chelatiphaga TaxID=517011 RepID=UPI000ADE88C0